MAKEEEEVEPEPSLVTRPLRAVRNRREAPSQFEMAVMSRPRFVCFQCVTMLTVIITSLTLLAVALLQNEELQSRLLKLGKTANFILNVTEPTDPELSSVNPEPANWKNLFMLLLKLSDSYAVALNQSNPNH